MFAVVVEFTVHPNSMKAFYQLMLENAHLSRETETGCMVFDVCTDPSRPTAVFLYEVYTDQNAFEVHKSTDHFRSFVEKSEGMYLAKSEQTYVSVVR